MSPGLVPSALAVLLLAAAASLLQAPASNAARGPATHFSRPPLYDLTRDDNDAAQLTDGRIAFGTMWRSRDAVGWLADGRRIEIDIDLGQTRSIGRICLHSARRADAGVSFPRRIDVFSSADGRRFSWEADAAASPPPGGESYLAHWFCTPPLLHSARHVAVVVDPQGPYFMTDEIRIEPGGSVAGPPDGADVEAGQLISFAIRRNAALASAEGLAESLAAPSEGDSGARMRSIARNIATGNAIRNLRGLADTERQIRSVVQAARASNGVLIRMRQADPYGPATPFDAAPLANPVGLQIARGTHGALAVAVDNAGSADAELEISTEITGPGAAGIVLNLFHAEPVLLLEGRWIADPLLPLGQALRVPFGESRQLWIDISAAAAGPAGGATVRVTVRRRGVVQASIELPMRVWTIGTTSSPPATVVWGYLDQTPIRRFPAAAAADMLAHGVDTAVLHGTQLPWPSGARGETVGSYDGFDAAIHDLGGHRRYLFFLGWGEGEQRLGGYRYMTPEWRNLFARWLREWVGRMRRAGIGYDRFALYPVDEPGTPEARANLLAIARLVRSVDPQVRIYTTIGQADVISNEMIDLVDVFQLNGPALRCDIITRLRQRGRTVWAYQTTGGGKAADPGTFYRAQGWQAFAAGISGFGFWSYADIGVTGTAWTDLDDIRADFAVIYDTPDGFVSSRRWEAWREGVQDFRLLSSAFRAARTGAERQSIMTLARMGTAALAPNTLNGMRATLMRLASRKIAADAPEPARGCNL